MNYPSPDYDHLFGPRNAFGRKPKPNTTEGDMVDQICKLFYNYGKFVGQPRTNSDIEVHAPLLCAYNDAVAWLASQSGSQTVIANKLKQKILAVHTIIADDLAVQTVGLGEKFHRYRHRIADMDATLAGWYNELREVQHANAVGLGSETSLLVTFIEKLYFSVGVFVSQKKHDHDGLCGGISLDGYGYEGVVNGLKEVDYDKPPQCKDMGGWLYSTIIEGYNLLETGVEHEELNRFVAEGVEEGLHELVSTFSVDALSAVSGTDFSVHDRCAKHSHYYVRYKSASDENCPDEVLIELAKDDDESVLRSVYETLAVRSSESDHRALSVIAGDEDTIPYLLHLVAEDSIPWHRRDPYRQSVSDLARGNLRRQAHRTMEAEDPNTAFHGVTMMVHTVMVDPDFEEMFSGLGVKEKAMARKKNASFTDVQLAGMFPGGLDDTLKDFTIENPHFPLGILSAWVKRDDPDQRLRWFPMLAFYLVAVVSRRRYWELGFTSVNYNVSDNLKYAQYAK